MAEPEKKLPVGLATTQIESEEEPAARRLPTPVVIDEDDADEGPDPRIGKVLGGLYRVESLLGEGGMGKVYAARHVHINKLFAIKVLSHKIASDRQSIERLRQEAVAASSIDHDNIVNVVSFDTTDDGDVFIVMELLKGDALADIIERGPLGVTRALTIGVQICRALHAAHEAGIVHRDLKPENVFVLNKNGLDVAKILDFGISKVKTAETEKVRMTRTGQLVGTPLYMSPEQARGEVDIDRRADIYAAGVILYEMLAGTPPFDGGNYFQLLWKHGNEEPEPLHKRAPSVPRALADVVMKTLAKARDERYQTMAELEQALLATDPRLSVPVHVSLAPSLTSAAPAAPAKAEPRSRWPIAAVAVAAVIGLVVAVALATGRDPEPIAVEPLDRAEPLPVMSEPVMTEPVMTEPASVQPEMDELPVGVDPAEEVRMSFVSEPPGAIVTVNGVEIGRSPVERHLVEGDGGLTVRFSLPGYRAEQEVIEPENGRTVRVTLRRREALTSMEGAMENALMMDY
jgi:serine/threonine-protein kinase